MKTGLITFLILLVVPTMALAACSANANVWNPNILAGPLVTCTGNVNGSGTVCKSLCDLVCTVANVIYFFIGVVIWIITPIMVALGGIRIMLSRGNPGQLESAKKMIWGTVVGLLIVLCAYLIVLTFVRVLGVNFIGSFSSGSGGTTPICTF